MRIRQQLPAWSTAMAGALILGALAAPRVGAYGAADALMVAAALVAGPGIVLRAVRALRQRQASIELLVTIAASGALVIGEYWEAAAVTFLFQLGAWLEQSTLRRTRAALGELLDLAPETAVVVRDGRRVTVSPMEVVPGETVVVLPGSRVPVDGVVTGGSAFVDESMITGEPMAVEKGYDATVHAGTVSASGLLEVRAVGVGADTTLARIVRRVEAAQEAKAPTQRFMERFARWYTPAIIAMAAGAVLLTGQIELALTLLVIGCPGALVISTPVSIVAGIGRAARRGILIKGGQHLEDAGRIDAIAFDKTGTLTEGRPRLVSVTPAAALARGHAPALAAAGGGRGGGVGRVEGDGRGEGGSAFAGDKDTNAPEREVLRVAAITESGSEHPLARPILAAASELGLDPLPQPADVTTRPGRGIVAVHEGRTLAVGNARLMDELGLATPPELAGEVERLVASGATPALVADGDQVVGVIGITDAPRRDAAAALDGLRRAGVRRLVMLTGDARPAAETVAAAVGISEVHAGLLPEEKLERIEAMRRDGFRVAMVGDGINDAPALAAADVSVAMGAAGTDVALETADLALMADDLSTLPEAIRIARATRRNIRQNVALALATVAALLAGVLAGEVHMAGGMLVHQASVLAVIANGMRLLKA